MHIQNPETSQHQKHFLADTTNLNESGANKKLDISYKWSMILDIITSMEDMYMKKFSICSLILLVTLTCAFANAASESSSANGTPSGTVTMWTFPITGNDQEMMAEMVEEFNKIYPDITVDVQVLPWSGRYEKMLTAVAGGNPPNVVYLNDFQICLFAETDNLVDMREVFSEDEIALYKSGALETASVNGKLYGIPVLLNSLGYFYNVNLFEEAGLDPNNPPQTWNELLDAIKKLTKYDANGNVIQYGVSFNLNRPSPATSILPLIWQAGGDILDEEGNVIIDSAETREALSFIKSLFDNGYAQKANITGGGIKFSSGNIGIDLQKEPNEIKKTALENPDLNFMVGPILSNKTKVGYVSCGTYAMFKGAKNNEVAKLWLRFIANNENVTKVLAGGGFASPKKDLPESSYMTDSRSIAMAAQSEWATKTAPMNAHYSEILAACGASFNAIILGEKDMDKGLRELSQQLTQIMSN